jgi:hypothetical protein
MPARPFFAASRSPVPGSGFLEPLASWPYLWAICSEGSHAEKN